MILYELKELAGKKKKETANVDIQRREAFESS